MITTPEQMREAAIVWIDAMINAANKAGLDDRKEGLRDAQHAIRAIPAAPQPTPIVDGSGPGPHYVADMLSQFVASVWHLLDNSETSGPIDDPITTVMQSDFDEVSKWLDRFESLPSGSTSHLSAAELVAAYLSPQPSENRLFDPDSHWGDFIRSAVTEAEKAMRKYPQPNYIITKVAEEAGEVVKAAVHAAEGRETLDNVRGEMLQLVAMLFRLWMEGDQVHGLPPVSGVMTASAKTAAPQPVAVTVKPLTAADLSEALSCFWNAAIGASHNMQDGIVLASIMAEGIAAVQIRLQEIADTQIPPAALTIHPADPLSDPRVKPLVEALRHINDYIDTPSDSTISSLKDDLIFIHSRSRAALRAIGGEA